MPGQAIAFIDNKTFRTKGWAKILKGLDVPAIPSAPHYEPWSKDGPVRPTFILKREEERLRFLQLNWYKLVYNRCLKILDTEGCGRADRVSFIEAKRLVTHMTEYLARVNMPLIYSQVARNRTRYGLLDWNEAVSECQPALIRALNNYNVSFGTKFSTFAVRVLLNAMKSANQKRGLKLSRVHTVEMPDAYGDDGPGVAQDADLADRLESLQHVMNGNLARLSHVEQAVIRARFGPESNTLEAVGKSIGVSKERVRQIQNKALDKLRGAMAGRS